MSIRRHRSADDALASKPWSAILLVKCNLQDLIQFSLPVEPTDGRGAGGKGGERDPEMAHCAAVRPAIHGSSLNPALLIGRRCGDATVRLVDLCGSAKTAVHRANRLNGLAPSAALREIMTHCETYGVTMAGTKQKVLSVQEAS